MEPKIPSEKIVRKVRSSVRNAHKEAMKGQIVPKIIFVEDVEKMVIWAKIVKLFKILMTMKSKSLFHRPNLHL